MSGFIANSNMYNITTENELSVILSHFDSEYIFNIIKSNIDNRFRYSHMPMPNIVASYEQNFKQLQTIYVDNIDARKQIEETRTQTYQEIISILCSEFQFSFNYQEFQDFYSAAFYLYSFFVSEFSVNMTNFFANFIVKERNKLYDSLKLAEYKKNKDTSTIYNKKLYKNSKLAIINAQLEYVIQNICVIDMPLNIVLSNIYPDINIVKFLECAIRPQNDFFKSEYVSKINSDLLPMILTDIRLEIQRQSVSEDIDVLNIK